ncbi:cytochrome b5 [Grosmannia clavigera kw1407]|uniref:Cytochrome b5 n=1 Tax=Grosmannia clavigera (strain kw1407 / UAMH 11150) TaxID=655863 RepID=F0X9V4_GROCL|nr:cytochrome b5 [Grosmannia clavigera kw1407]EFX05736.1 cytochrome b5 [Grosmannia clavigera kw1407]
MASLPEFTADEVAAHKTQEDLWIAVHGRVYNVASYLQDHPGGAAILLDVAGTDASHEYDDAGHSEDADEIMAALVVGTLQGTRVGRPTKTVQLIQSSSSSAKTVSSSSSLSLHVLPVLAMASVPVGAAVAAVYLPGLWGAHNVSRLLCLLPSPSHGSSNPATTFGGGVLVASLFWTALVGVAGSRLSARFLHIDSGFTRFPIQIRTQTTTSRRVARPRPLLQAAGFLDPKTYKTLPLVAKTELAPGVFRLEFRLPQPTDVLGLPVGQHVAIQATIDGQTVARSYTPTSNNADRGRLELLVRCYPDGLLTGRYLALLQVGDTVRFRGPKGAMRYNNPGGRLCRRIGMIAGGTGITPMFQLIRAICDDSHDQTEVSLIYANRSEPDMLLRRELDAFARQYPRNLKVWYMLDHPPADWPYGSGFVTADVMRERLPKPAPDTKIMLCGPPGMINASKAALQSLGFQTPGPVSRMTDQVFCF